MKKTLDYQKMYQTQYKKIPNYVFWATFITLGLGAIIAGIVLFAEASWEEDYFVAAAVLVGGPFVAYLLARIDRWITALLLCQKIVVADTLLDIKNGSAAAPVEIDNLPEL